MNTNCKELINQLASLFGLCVVSRDTPRRYRQANVENLSLWGKADLLQKALQRVNHETQFESKWREFLSCFPLRDSASEHGQDIFARFCFQDLAAGSFVEFGAHDGLTFSNTLLLEHLGWKGLLIEPVNEPFQQCLKNRDCDVLRAAIDPLFGVNKTVQVVNAGLQSATFQGLNLRGETTSRADIIDNAKRNQAIRERKVENVPLVNLHSILEGRGSLVDFMTVDIEGGEADFAENFDFKRFGLQVVCIEHNWRASDSARITMALESSGYILVLPEYSARDLWFVAEERYRKLSGKI